jgi:hypothetical protein
MISRVCIFGKLLINSRAHDNILPLHKCIVDNLRVLTHGKVVKNLFLAPSSKNYKRSGKLIGLTKVKTTPTSHIFFALMLVIQISIKE